MMAIFSALKSADLEGWVPGCLLQNGLCPRSGESLKVPPALSMARPGSRFYSTHFKAAQSQKQRQGWQVCPAETFLQLQVLENTSIRAGLGKRHCLEMITA